MQKDKLLKKVQSDYNQIAESFSDTRNKSWPEFEVLFEKTKKYTSDQLPVTSYQILDLACGNGRLFDFLNSKFSILNSKFSYTGLDNSQELLKQAKKLHLKKTDHRPLTTHYQHIQSPIANRQSPTFQYGDLLSIPFPDHHFDHIWCIAAFHHLPKEYQLEAAKEILRVMKKDAILVITTWDLWQPKYWKEILKSFFRNPLRTQNLFIPWKKGKNKVDRFYYAFTANEFKKTFEKTGFKILDKFNSKHNFCLICKS